eukprot:1964487-Amphidinium_carterae.1
MQEDGQYHVARGSEAILAIRAAKLQPNAVLRSHFGLSFEALLSQESTRLHKLNTWWSLDEGLSSQLTSEGGAPVILVCWNCQGWASRGVRRRKAKPGVEATYAPSLPRPAKHHKHSAIKHFCI